MANIKRSIEIAASRHSVWTVVADLRAVAAWNPNVVHVDCAARREPDVGTSRTCYLVGGGHIDETVSAMEPPRRIGFAIGSHGGIRSADMAIELTEGATGTSVTAVADYHVAFGPLGPVIDRLAIKRQMARMLDRSLLGLREHLENEAKTNTGKELS